MAGTPYDVLGIRSKASLGEAREAWLRETRLLLQASDHGDTEAIERRKLINCAYEEIKRKSLHLRIGSNATGSEQASSAERRRDPEPQSELQIAFKLASQLYHFSGSSELRERCSVSIMTQLCANADAGILRSLADGIFRSIPDYGAEPSVQGVFGMLLHKHASVVSSDHVEHLARRLLDPSTSAASRQRCGMALRSVLTCGLAATVIEAPANIVIQGLAGSAHLAAVRDVFKDLLDRYPHLLTSENVRSLSESLSNSFLSHGSRGACGQLAGFILKAGVSDSVKGVLADGVMRAMMDYGHVREIRDAFTALVFECPDRISIEYVHALAGQLLYTGSQHRQQCALSLLTILNVGARREVLLAMAPRVRKAAEARGGEPLIQELAATLDDMLAAETKRGWRATAASA